MSPSTNTKIRTGIISLSLSQN